jgi:hypothetical protein
MISPLVSKVNLSQAADFVAHRDCNSAMSAHFKPRTVIAVSATSLLSNLIQLLALVFLG